jgi:hypothetical protein
MFLLMQLVPMDSVATLTSAVGHHSQIAVDQSTGDRWMNTTGTWQKVRNGNETPVTPPLAGSVTVRNSSGSITRALTAVAGVVTLAATDTIVANGNTAILQTSAGTTSSTTATLNSPATATVAAGVLTAVKASA